MSAVYALLLPESDLNSVCTICEQPVIDVLVKGLTREVLIPATRNIKQPPDEERRTSQQLQSMSGQNNTAPNGTTSLHLTMHGTTPPCWSRQHYTSRWQGNAHSSTKTREQPSRTVGVLETTSEVRFLTGIDMTPIDPCRVQDLYY